MEAGGGLVVSAGGDPKVAGKAQIFDWTVLETAQELLHKNDYVAAADDGERMAALARHLQSVRAHLKELSGKNYQLLHQLNSLDFVIMFLPIEPAFMLAIAQDANLWDDAYQKNVLLVSPSTLLFVVRTVAHLWRTERQNQSVAEIVKRGAALYDKLRGFVEALREVGTHLDQAKSSYSDAYSKLTTGNGNVIRQAQMLTELGVKPKKPLPTDIVEFSSDESLALPEKAAAATNAT